MKIILATPYARIGISEEGDSLPDDLPAGTVTIMPIANCDAFFDLEALRKALKPENPLNTPEPVKCDPAPIFLEPGDEVQEGFIVLSNNGGGAPAPGFRDTTTGQVRVHANESTAQLEIIEAIEEEFQEFRAGLRKFDELHFSYQDWVEPATLYPDGVVATEDDEFPPVIP